MPRILIADDDAPNADLLEAHLDGSGYETKIALNGEETLAAARDVEARPHPARRDDAEAERVRGVPPAPRRSGDPRHRACSWSPRSISPPTWKRPSNAGTDDFITKPINKTELLLRVRAMLESRGEADDLERALAYIGRVQHGL